MKRRLVPCLLFVLSVIGLQAADKITVTVTNDLDIPRPSETISVPWAEVIKALPDALVHSLIVKDAAGNSLAHQVTNIKPLEPKGSYGELLFQYDFKAGEKSAKFTVEKSAAVTPPFPSKTFARPVPERLDDFAWENDRIAHRIYGPALAAPRPAGSNKEVLVTSGIDVWLKRVRYPIVDRWYNKGHNHYHVDEGEGMDFYSVRTSRGCGGTGIWDGQKLYVATNYKNWQILANGPVRTIFELTYETWAGPGMVFFWETKRFTVDAGHNLDLMESTFTVQGKAENLSVAVGLAKHPGDAQEQVSKVQEQGILGLWETYAKYGQLGTAAVLEPGTATGFAEDDQNHLILTKLQSGKPVRYLIGAGWDKSGDFKSKADWDAYLGSEAKRFASPVKVAVTTP